MPPTPATDDEEQLARSARAALSRYEGLLDARLAPLGRGLINRTFAVDGARGALVLQRVNAIFAPAIHDNIHAVTERLAACGLETPRLLATDDGARFVDLGAGGVWRVMTRVAGGTFDVIAGPGQARAAAALVARFHAALDGLVHEFVGLRSFVHDTPRHLATLEGALADHRGHRLFASVLPVARAILDAAAALPPLPAIAPRVCHGDLKFNNVLFDEGDESRAIALVDLDTVGPLSLGYELGDAWRSWCNASGEDRADAVFDLDVFAASLDGYLGSLGRALTADEARALLHGVEWITVELAARFCADALRESYFGWDAARFPSRGDHNLVRAKSQLSLHRATLATRPARARLLGVP